MYINLNCCLCFFLISWLYIPQPLGPKWFNVEQRKIVKFPKFILKLHNKLEGRCVECHMGCLFQVDVSIVYFCVSVYMSHYFFIF